MSIVRRRKSRLKFKDELTISGSDELSRLLSQGPAQLSKSSGEKYLNASKTRENSFVEKRLPERNDDDEIKVAFTIGRCTYELDDFGNWTANCPDFNEDAEKQRLKAENVRLSQENNLIRVKNELLADMIATKTLRKKKVEKKLERLKAALSRSSMRFCTLVDSNKNDKRGSRKSV